RNKLEILYKFRSCGVCISDGKYVGSFMNCQNLNPSVLTENSSRSLRGFWFLAIACVLIVLIAIFLPRPNTNSPAASASTNGLGSVTGANSPRERSARVPHIPSPAGPAPTAEEIVAGKLNQLGKDRRKLVHAI